MDRIVRIERYTDQIFWGQNKHTIVLEIVDGNWVHMMNIDSATDFQSGDSEIATIVAKNNLPPYAFPFRR